MATRSPRTRSKSSIAQAIAEVAPQLDLEMEAAPAEKRMVGLVLAPAAHDAQDVDSRHKPKPIGPKDKKDISKVILDWHKMPFNEIVKRWRSVSTDPYVAVLPTGLKQLNESGVKRWVRSRGFKEAIEKFGPYKPRRVSITSLRIVYLGHEIASATFKKTETGKYGVSAGNEAAILLKTAKGWRITVISANSEFKAKKTAR